jgi:hypothetical protein
VQGFNQAIDEVYQRCTERVAALCLRNEGVVRNLLLRNVSGPLCNGGVYFTHSLQLILHIFYPRFRIICIIDIVYGDLRTATRTLENEVHKLGQGLMVVFLISGQPLGRDVLSRFATRVYISFIKN